MPAYNAEKTILESIESVISQTYLNWELIIIDDCSNDMTLEIIKKYSIQDSRIKLIKNEFNLGVSSSRNISIKNCSGDFICFLDSDDIWSPNKLEKQMLLLNSGWDVVCSNYTTFSDDSNIILQHRKSPPIIKYTDMLKSNFIGNLTGIYNRKKLGTFFQKKLGHEDYVMWLNILNKSRKAYCIQEPLAKYRISKKSISANKIKTMQWQWFIYRNELQFSLIKSMYYFSHYIVNALKKRR